MFVNNYNQWLIPIENPDVVSTAIEGRWWHFHRVYVLKDEQDRMYTIRLNWFDRVFAHVRYFGMEAFFKAVFEGRKLVYLSAKELCLDPETITPQNFEDIFALDNDTANIGDINIVKHPWEYVLVVRIPNEYMPKIPGWLNIHLLAKNNQFVVETQLSTDRPAYDTLKGVLDHLYRGKYYQEDILRGIEYFTLTKKDGTKVRYYNPYLNP